MRLSTGAWRSGQHEATLQEGNGRRRDLSSTEQYQRDSILHFLWWDAVECAVKCSSSSKMSSQLQTYLDLCGSLT